MAETTPTRKRLALLFIAVGIALIVERTLASGGEAETDVVGSTKGAPAQADGAAAAPARAASAAAAALHLEALAVRRDAGEVADARAQASLFVSQSWQPPAPPPAAEQAAEPEPPPFA